MKRRTVWAMLALATLLVSGTARADLILGTGATTTWNRSTNPTSSDLVTIPIYYSGSGDNLTQGFELGFTITGGNGSLALYQASNASTNALFPSSGTTFTVNSPATGVTAVNVLNGTSSDVTVPVSPGYNAVQLSFYSPNNDASGTFQVALNGTYTNYFSSQNLDGSQFTYSNGANLATVSVNVPEPSTLASLLTGGICVLGAGWYSRRRKTAPV
jgi:hypothetical protein